MIRRLTWMEAQFHQPPSKLGNVACNIKKEGKQYQKILSFTQQFANKKNFNVFLLVSDGGSSFLVNKRFKKKSTLCFYIKTF